ncbi:hypothetical protein MNBD_ACTINO02-1322 [hydrothermal vent metagenome]|uniref:RNA polymerase ECF-type sigma factor n=1 Tax=hydrothermal vent metagenome TaxID=652676 RepID=A0A3B0SLH3_9ZZZZ
MGGTTVSHLSISGDDPTIDADRVPVSAGRDPVSDEKAVRRFEELYRAHYRRIVDFARRRTGSVEAAEDVASATFLVAWRRIDDLVGADEPLAWLYRVAYLTLLSHRRGVERTRRLANKTAAEYSNPVSIVESTIEARDRLTAVSAAAETLSTKDREIVWLIGWEDCTHEEIAEILGLSRVLVRTRLSRARTRLQTAYDKRLGRPRSRDSHHD